MILPRIQPIAPTWHKHAFDDPGWLFDFKYDGFRALDVDDAVIDGEIITADETGRPQFYDLLRGTRTPAYVAFDVVNGGDLRSMPLSERRRRLQDVLPTSRDVSPTITEALSVTGRGRELFELMCAHDLEGVVGKRLADSYDPRVKWLKIKNPDYSQKEGRGDLFERRPWWRDERYRDRAGVEQ